MSEYKIVECSIPLNNLNINQISDQRFSNLKIAPGKAHKLAIQKGHRTTKVDSYDSQNMDAKDFITREFNSHEYQQDLMCPYEGFNDYVTYILVEQKDNGTERIIAESKLWNETK